jgi:hypothetical protein
MQGPEETLFVIHLGVPDSVKPVHSLHNRICQPVQPRLRDWAFGETLVQWHDGARESMELRPNIAPERWEYFVTTHGRSRASMNG